MRVKVDIKRTAVIYLLALVAWCIVIFAFADYDRIGFYFWGGFAFGAVSFITAVISLLFIKTYENENLTEINYIPFYYTSAYLLVSLVINSCFVYRMAGKYNLLLVIANLLILFAFIAIRVNTDDYAKDLDKQTKKIEKKIESVSAISTRMSVLLSIVTDPEIKKALLKLKEKVDFSSNLSQDFLAESQNLFILQLEQIQEMISGNKSKDEILKKIQEATVTWNSRNSVASSIK